MEIRFAKKEDTAAILNLLRQVGQVHHEGRPDIFRQGAQKYNAQQVQELIQTDDVVIFIAAEESQVLGYCFCFMKRCKNDPVMCDRKELYIDDLCIDESKRGQRIGKCLYEAACDYAKAQGCHSVTLNVWCCNESAMGFYQSLGMKPQKIGMEQVL